MKKKPQYVTVDKDSEEGAQVDEKEADMQTGKIWPRKAWVKKRSMYSCSSALKKKHNKNSYDGVRKRHTQAG